MCCIRLSVSQTYNITKTILRGIEPLTSQAVVITKEQNFRTIKRRTFTAQHRFIYFFDVTNTKKSYSSLK